MKPQTSGHLRLHLVEPICYFIDEAKQLTLIDGDDVIVLSEAEAWLREVLAKVRGEA